MYVHAIQCNAIMLVLNVQSVFEYVQYALKSRLAVIVRSVSCENQISSGAD